jgi:hypothetical protein
MILTPVITINNLTIYKRDRKHETYLPLYVVSLPDGRHLEEFRRLPRAKRFCRETLDFVHLTEPCGVCEGECKHKDLMTEHARRQQTAIESEGK